MSGPAGREPRPPEPPRVNPPRRPRRRPTLRGEAPTETIPLAGSLRGTPYRDPRVTRAVAEERAANEAMDLALRVSEVMLRCGASAHTVESAAVAVGVACGLEDMDVDLTMQSMHMQCRTGSGATITRLRVVRAPRQDFARLAAVHALVDDLVSGELDTEQASQELRRISRTPRTWSRWVVALAQGFIGAGVALSLGASFFGVLVAVLSAVAVDLALRATERLHLPEFYLGAIGGLTSTVVAFVAYAAGSYGFIPMSPTDFAFVMAGGIVMLLPSRPLTSAMEDVLSGYPVTGSARLLEVMLNTFGLIVGVATGLGLSIQTAAALELGLLPPPITKLAFATASEPRVIMGSLLVGVAGAIWVQNGMRMLAPAGLLSLLTVASAMALGDAGIGRVTAAGLSAVVLGFAARLVALRLDSPALTLAVPASYGIMPGLSIFIGLYEMTGSGGDTWATSNERGVVAVLTALGVIFAIATGARLGELLAVPLDRPVAVRRRSWRQGTDREEAVTPAFGYAVPSGERPSSDPDEQEEPPGESARG